MKVLLVVLLGLIPYFGNAFEMRVNHDPWWMQDLSSNTVQTSYQFQKFPCNKRNTHDWSLACKMLKTTGWSPTPVKKPNKMSGERWRPSKATSWPLTPARKPSTMSEERWRAMNAREWPEWIPPIRMIKLPLDEPPAF